MAVIAYGSGKYYTGTASSASVASPSVSSSTFCRVDVWLVGSSGAVGTVTATGFTASTANKQAVSTNNWTMATFYKFISTGQNVSVSWTGSRQYAILVSTRTGVNSSTPVDVQAGNTTTTNQVPSGTFTASAVGYTADIVVGLRNSVSGVTWSSPATEVDHKNGGSSPNRHAFVGFHSTTTASASILVGNSAAGPAAAITLVLIPATATLTAPTPRTWTNGSIDEDDLNDELRDSINWVLSPPRIISKLTANVSISNQTFTAVNFNSEVARYGFTHSLTSNQRQHTVQVAGFYYVFGNARWADGGGTGQRRIELYKNGSTDGTGGTLFATQNYGEAASADTSRLSASGFIRVSAGDFLQAIVYQSSGGALNLQSSETFFGAVFLTK